MFRISGLASPLHLALAASVAVHLGLLAVKLADPQALQRAFSAAPLEVVLVNARSAQAPQESKVLAQASLSGGGTASDQQHSTAPAAAAAQVMPGDESLQARRRLQQLQQEQAQLLARLQQDAALPQADRHSGLKPSQRADQEERAQMAQQLAQIERRINEENAKPRRRYVSPATREVAYAMYYDTMRRRIEERGTLNFPEAGGRKLYGELTMNITVDAAGRLLETAIVQSSGSSLLDERAVAIVRSAGPFGYFSVAMRRDYDQLVLTSRFRFTRDDALQASTAIAPR